MFAILINTWTYIHSLKPHYFKPIRLQIPDSKFRFFTATDPCTTDTRRTTSIDSISFRSTWTVRRFRRAHGSPTWTAESPEKSTRSSSRRYQSSTRGAVCWRAIGEKNLFFYYIDFNHKLFSIYRETPCHQLIARSIVRAHRSTSSRKRSVEKKILK